MKSMTGFGSGDSAGEDRACRVEISSVNRKQLDISVTLPRELMALEKPVRALVVEHITRGRVSVRVAFESLVGKDPPVRMRFNRELARQYVAALAEIDDEINGDSGTSSTSGAASVLRAPGVVELEEEPLATESAWPLVEEAFAKAEAGWSEMRVREGQNLAKMLEDSVAVIGRVVAQIQARAPEVVEYHREALHRRLREASLAIDLDDERLVREMGLFADRCDISEETTRLKSHLEQFDTYFEKTEAVGRPLDFLAQEMNREFNTIGSKANDARLAQRVVEGKTEVERVREQMQNVE